MGQKFKSLSHLKVDNVGHSTQTKTTSTTQVIRVHSKSHFIKKKKKNLSLKANFTNTLLLVTIVY